MEEAVDSMVKEQARVARNNFGANVDLPTGEAMAKLREGNNPLLKVFEDYIKKGYKPEGKTAIEFYAYCLKEEMLKARVPKSDA